MQNFWMGNINGDKGTRDAGITGIQDRSGIGSDEREKGTDAIP